MGYVCRGDKDKVTSKLHSEEIGAQLELADILNCYSLKVMEEKQPTDIPGEGATTKEKLLDAYVKAVDRMI